MGTVKGKANVCTALKKGGINVAMAVAVPEMAPEGTTNCVL